MDDSFNNLSFAQRFFNAAQPKSETFDLPGVGDVTVVELREADVSDIRRRVESEKDTAKRSKQFGMGLVVRSVFKDGAPIFNDDDIDRFTQAGNATVEKLAAVVLRLNGYGSESGN